MLDSKNLGSGLTIPVAMVKMSDGARLASRARGSGGVAVTLECKCDTGECVICRDSYEVGCRVMRLPLCGHVFHEGCAKQWLASHNTCPYCRREYPCKDDKGEVKRRRGTEVDREWEEMFG